LATVVVVVGVAGAAYLARSPSAEEREVRQAAVDLVEVSKQASVVSAEPDARERHLTGVIAASREAEALPGRQRPDGLEPDVEASLTLVTESYAEDRVDEELSALGRLSYSVYGEGTDTYADWELSVDEWVDTEVDGDRASVELIARQRSLVRPGAVHTTEGWIDGPLSAYSVGMVREDGAWRLDDVASTSLEGSG
jgi:hypothetical protein